MFDFLPFFAVLVGFIATFVLGFFVIPYLKKFKFGQTIRDEGPKWHQGQSGTPTMGGIMIFGGLVASIVLSLIFTFITSGKLSMEFNDSTRTAHWFAAFGLAVGMGAIGFVDDFIKVVKKRNLGLTARQKTFAQLIVSAVYLIALIIGGMKTTYIPFIGDVNVVSGFGLIFWPIALFFIYGFTNAVNLIDGLDGLACGVSTICAISLFVRSKRNELSPTASTESTERRASPIIPMPQQRAIRSQRSLPLWV